MNAKELIVRIKAIFSREGEVDLAKPLENLSKAETTAATAVKAETAALTDSAQAATSSAEAHTQAKAGSMDFTVAVLDQMTANDQAAAKQRMATDALHSARSEMDEATRASFHLREAAEGSVRGFEGSARAAYLLGDNIGALVGKLTLVGAAFSAGWEVGSKIREKWVDPLWETKEKADAAGHAALDLANKLKDTNAVKFAGIISEMEALFQATEKADREIEKTFARQKELASARTATAIAEKKTEPDSSDKLVDVAKLQKSQSMGDAQTRVSEADTLAKEAKRALDQVRFKADEARATRDAAASQHEQTAQHAGLTYGETSTEFLRATRQSRENKEAAEVAYAKALEEETRMRAIYNEKIADWIQAFQVSDAKVDEARASYLGDLQAIDKSGKLDPKHPFGVVYDEMKPPRSPQDDALDALRARQAIEEADVARTRNPANAGNYASADEYQQVLEKEQADVGRVTKAIEEVLGGNQAVLQNILTFMEQLKQQNLQIKDQIRRMPL